VEIGKEDETEIEICDDEICMDIYCFSEKCGQLVNKTNRPFASHTDGNHGNISK